MPVPAVAHSAQFQQAPTQQPAPLMSRNLVYGMAPFRGPSCLNYQRNVHKTFLLLLKINFYDQQNMFHKTFFDLRKIVFF